MASTKNKVVSKLFGYVFNFEEDLKNREKAADSMIVLAKERVGAIISACEKSFAVADARETDVEKIMNGIMSMLSLCSGDKSE